MKLVQLVPFLALLPYFSHRKKPPLVDDRGRYTNRTYEKFERNRAAKPPRKKRPPKPRPRGLRLNRFTGELASWCLAEFEPNRLIERSPRTIKAYRGAIRALGKYLQRPSEITDLTTDGLDSFAQWRLLNASMGSVQRDLDCLHAMGIYAWQTGRLTERPRRGYWKSRLNKGDVK